jgi:hypothetical protein
LLIENDWKYRDSGQNYACLPNNGCLLDKVIGRFISVPVVGQSDWVETAVCPIVPDAVNPACVIRQRNPSAWESVLCTRGGKGEGSGRM